MGGDRGPAAVVAGMLSSADKNPDLDFIVHGDEAEGIHAAIELPARVTLEIVEADPVVKGQTASSSYKPAILSNGARIMVPPHIGTGTRVVVTVADGSYVERAKD